jgi:hypothetical protein
MYSSFLHQYNFNLNMVGNEVELTDNQTNSIFKHIYDPKLSRKHLWKVHAVSEEIF